MDLNTVMKKLKSFQYKSKKEFVDDLMLIWNNCLVYNTDPKHFLRAHALAMKRKTEALIPLIPDITVRDRAEVEAEEARLSTAAGIDDNEGDSDDGNNPRAISATSRKGIGSGKAHSKKGGRKRKLENEADSSGSMIKMAASKANSRASPFHRIDPLATPIMAASTPRYSTPGLPNDPSQADLDESDDDLNDLDYESSVYREVFLKRRTAYCSRRYELFKNNRLQTEVEALMRNSTGMAVFDRIEEQSFLPSEERELRVQESGASTNLFKVLDQSEKQPFLYEYEVESGIPAVPWTLSNSNPEGLIEHSSQKSPPSYLVESGLGLKISNNLREMQQIRKICSKISLIRQMQQQSYMHASQIKPYAPEDIVETDIDPESRLPDRDVYDGEASFVALKRSTAKIAMHTGYEVTEPIAMDALTEIAANFLENMGKSLVMWMEGYNRTKGDNEDDTKKRFDIRAQRGNSSKSIQTTPSAASQVQSRFKPDKLEDMLTSALLESGCIDSISSLDSYIRDDIEKHGQRLQELTKKLTTFLGDLLRPGFVELNDNQFDDGSEQFVNGDFSEELGDDFFGFKELGLDKELGLLTSSVPLHLLHGRFNAALSLQSDLPLHKNRLSDVPDYSPVDMTIAHKQIGLLRSFFVAKLDALSSSDVLLEGAQLPPKQRNTRPKVPPTGKIVGPKKKPLSKAFFLPEPEPEPKPEPTEDLNNGDVKEKEKSPEAAEGFLGDNLDSLF